MEKVRFVDKAILVIAIVSAAYMVYYFPIPFFNVDIDELDSGLAKTFYIFFLFPIGISFLLLFIALQRSVENITLARLYIKGVLVAELANVVFSFYSVYIHFAPEGFRMFFY